MYNASESLTGSERGVHLKQGARGGRMREARQRARMRQILRTKTYRRVNQGPHETITTNQTHEMSHTVVTTAITRKQMARQRMGGLIEPELAKWE